MSNGGDWVGAVAALVFLFVVFPAIAIKLLESIIAGLTIGGIIAGAIITLYLIFK